MNKPTKPQAAAKGAFQRIAFTASPVPEAQQALIALRKAYGDYKFDEADVIVALGGDGFMLLTMHENMARKIPIYGMNRGSVGFLMNEFGAEGLKERLEMAERTTIHPLRMHAKTSDGKSHEALAINEVALLRQTRQAAKIKISVDGRERLAELNCDGVLVATPAGSTAYNLSAHGPILPIDADLLALTPISAFRPRRWRGALLPHRAKVRFEILENEKRPVSAVADYTEFRRVTVVDVDEDRSISLYMLFDAGHNLDERILNEQFVY
jgi:NAD+ kinase